MRLARRPEARGERGAASLETVGVTIIASVLAVALLVAVTPQARIIAQHFSYAICQVVTFGQGGCTPPVTSPEAHEPTEPCVLTQDGVERNAKISVIVFTASDGRRIEVQRLSNGEYRVTVTDTNGAGVEAGVGGGLSLTVNDTTVGANASAGVGAELTINAGDTYYTDQDGLENLMNALLRDQVKDAVVGDGGPTRWLVDGAEHLFGVDNDLPTPDERYAEGGISLNASAEATGGLSSASAGVDAAQMLGVRTNRDGTTTIYLSSTVSGEAGFSTLGYDTDSLEMQGANLSGEVNVVTAVTFDSEGNMISVQASSAASGSSAGLTNALFGGDPTANLSDDMSSTTLFQATLDIDSDADRDVANQYLLDQGVVSLGGWSNPFAVADAVQSTANFFQTALDRGVVTQQEYDTDSTTILGVNGSAELGVQLGVSADVTQDSMQITDAQYWDGTQWVDWEACSV